MNSPASGQVRETHTRRAWLGAFFLRLTLAVAGWWIISEGQAAALMVGLPAALVATMLSLILAAPARHLPTFTGTLLFLVYFIRRSIIAGFEVALYILEPVPAYRPAISRIQLHIPAGGPRLFLADCICLLPGSVSVALEGDILVLHRLNHTAHNRDVREVEKQVTRMFNLQLDIPDE